MTHQASPNDQDRVSWPFAVVVLAGAVALGLALSFLWYQDASPGDRDSAPPMERASRRSRPLESSVHPAPSDVVAVRRFREFEEWGAAKNINSRNEFRRLIRMRLSKYIAEEWERTATQELEQAKSDEQFASNKLIALGLVVFNQNGDSGFYLRKSLLSTPPTAETGKYPTIWNQWFAKLDKSDGCLIARRYLCDRCADLIVVGTDARPITQLSVDREHLPLLAWAARLRPDLLNDAFRNVEITQFPFIFPVECEAAQLLSSNWPAVEGISPAMNPVHLADQEAVAALRERLKLERSVKLEGFTDPQKAAIAKVFGAIERLLDHEDERTKRVYAQDWNKATLSASMATSH
jgi:hypothetical protein